MQVMEFTRGTGSALALVLTPDSPDALDRDLPQVTAAVRDWRVQQTGRCEMVMLTVVADPDHHAAIEACIAREYQGESELSSMLHAVRVEVALLNQRGKPAKEYQLGGPTANTVPKKPWWRFWG